MKPDKFDESIRRKLEGIQPGFQEEDWAKFKAYQSTHVPTSFVQRFGRSMLYTAASVAAAVMVFANVYQYRQNNRLDQQVDKLKTQLAQKERAPIRVSTRVDTVYITKYISVESRHPQPTAYAQALPQSNENESLIDPSATKTDPRGSVSEGLKNVGKIIRQNPNERISEAFERNNPAESAAADAKDRNNSLENPGVDRNIISSSKEKNPKVVLQKESSAKTSSASSGQTPSKQRSSEEVAGSIVQSEASVAANETVPQSPAGANTGGNPAIVANELMPLAPNHTLTDLEGLEPAEIKVQRYAYAILQSQTPKATGNPETTTPPPSISFKNVRFRIGGGLNAGDKYTGYSVMSSLLLGKYWSLDAGISWAKITGPQYFTEDIFKAQTGRPFQTWHKSDGIRPPLMPPQVLDIKTDVNLVRLPISLTYRWPINDNFAVLFSGGTNLNLSAKQCYRFLYKYKDKSDNYIEEKGQFSVKPALSNELVMATGVEKQWRSLVFQVEAYAAPYLQKPTYLTDNRNLGVRFKVLYQFGKKQI